MCQCTPGIKTPFCGKGTCQWPTPLGKRYDPLNDPREVRKLLTNAAYTGERIDNGKQSNRLSMASGLVRTVRDMAQHAGLSGEDHMTMLAYHALMGYEKCMDMMLDQEMLSPFTAKPSQEPKS